MPFVVPNEGETEMLQRILDTDVVLKLFTNDKTPAETDVLADYTEATAAGYADKTLATASWSYDFDAGDARANYADQDFIFTAGETVYGFMVTDVGVDIGPEKFIEVAKEKRADIIGVSALLTTTMVKMEDVIKAAKEAGLKAKVMIGGASVTQEFADKIGADGYAPDAPSAVGKAKELVKK